MKFSISISLYNRLDYTKQILEKLASCKLAEEIPTTISIEPSPVLYEIAGLADAYPHPKTIFVNEYRLGCNRGIWTAINRGFETGSDFNIHIEDDILLSRDALIYFTEMARYYEKDESVFCIGGYNRDPEIKTEADMGLFFPANTFYAWSWGVWYNRWNEIKNRWAFGSNPYGQSWDCYVKHHLRGNRSTVLPSVSRVKNIGALNGTFTPSAEWHDKKHNTFDKWADDFDVTFSPKGLYKGNYIAP